jgi:hypothetical protein
MARGRQTLTQRIALDGGKEIREELLALGRDGERAFKQLQAAANASSTGALGASLKALQGEMRELAASGAFVGETFGAVKTSFGQLSSSLKVFARNVSIAAGAVTGFAGAVFLLAKSGANAADEAGKAASSVGLTVDAYTGLQFAAEQSGVASGAFAASMGRLNKAIGDAANGSKSAIKQFGDLNVKFKGANGQLRPTEEVLGDIAERFARMPDGARKSALAIGLFGRAGAQLIPFLNEGRAGLAALIAQAERLGITFTAEQVRVATAMNDSLNALKRSVAGAKNQIGLLLAPDITRGSDFLISLLERYRGAIQNFAASIANEARGTLADFFKVLTGDEAGIDPRRGWIVEWTNAVKTFGKEVSGAFSLIIIPAYKAFVVVLNSAAAAFNSLFGSSLSGGQLGVVLAVAKLSGALAVLGASLNVARASAGFFAASLMFLWSVIRTGAASLTFLGVAFGVTFAQVALFGAAVALLILYFDEIKAGAERLFDFLGKLFSGDFSGAWQSFKEAGRAAFQGLETASATTWVLITAAGLKTFLLIKGAGVATAAAISTAFIRLGTTAALFGPFLAAAKVAFVKIVAAAGATLAGITLGFAAWPVAIAAALALGLVAFDVFAKDIRKLLDEEHKASFDSFMRYYADPLGAAATDLRRALGIPDGGLIGYLRSEVQDLKDEIDGANELLSDIGDGVDRSASERLFDWFKKQFGLFDQSAVDTVKNINKAFSTIDGGGAEDAFKKMADEAGIALRRVGDDLDKLAKASGAAIRTLPEGMRAAITEAGGAASALDKPVEETVAAAERVKEEVNRNLDAIDASPAFARVAGQSKEASDFLIADAEATAARMKNVYSTFGDFQIGADDPSFYAPIADGVSQSFSDAFADVLAKARDFAGKLAREFGVGTAQAAEATGQAFTEIDWQAIGAESGQALSTGIATGTQGALASVVTQAGLAAREVEAAFVGLSQRIQDAFAGIERTLGQVVGSVSRDIERAINSLIQVLARLEAAARKAAAAASAAKAAASSSKKSSAEGFASGGFVTGPGTSTSDSIPAWLSHSEFVQNARAVKYYGVDFMRQLNAMRIPRDLLKKLRGFSSGGLVTSAQRKGGLPAFSMGGLVDAVSRSFTGMVPQVSLMAGMAGMSNDQRFAALAPVTINLGNGQQVGGLFAPVDVVGELMRAAGEQQLLSTGNVPSWRGRR